MAALDAGLLGKAVALTPASVLWLLAGVEVREPERRPMVRLHLAGGQQIEGRLVRVDSDRAQDVVMVAAWERGGAVGPCLRYVLLSQVVAVDVDDPASYRDLLSGGALPVPATGDPMPSRLALRREFAPGTDWPVHVGWDTVPDAAEAVANLARLLAALRSAVERVRADELGGRAWAAVDQVVVEHRAGQELDLRRRPDGLEVVVDLSAALPRRLDDEMDRRLNVLL